MEGNIPGLGGMGHMLTNYLTALILSKVLHIPFIHNKLITAKKKRNMNIILKGNYFWNDFLGLDSINYNSQLQEIQNKIIKLKNIKLFEKPKKKLCFKSLNYFLDNFEKKYNEYNSNEPILLNCDCYVRFSIIDLLIYEKKRIIPEGVTKGIINQLRNCYYEKNKFFNKNITKKTIVLYIRKGDKNISYDLHLNIINILYKNNYLNNYNIYIISAGPDKDMKKIRVDFSKIIPSGIKFFLNDDECKVFKLMTTCDILVWKNSGFPLTASFYNINGCIISDIDSYKALTIPIHHNYNTFFDNYLFLNSVNNIDKDFLINWINNRISNQNDKNSYLLK